MLRVVCCLYDGVWLVVCHVSLLVVVGCWLLCGVQCALRCSLMCCSLVVGGWRSFVVDGWFAICMFVGCCLLFEASCIRC